MNNEKLNMLVAGAGFIFAMLAPTFFGVDAPNATLALMAIIAAIAVIPENIPPYLVFNYWDEDELINIQREIKDPCMVSCIFILAGVVMRWLLTGLAVICHGLLAKLGIMGAWLATNTVTIASLLYTAVVAHPAIAIIAIPLLVLTASLIIDSCWKSFNSKDFNGDIDGSDHSRLVGSGDFSQKQGNFLANDENKNRTDESEEKGRSYLSSLLSAIGL